MCCIRAGRQGAFERLSLNSVVLQNESEPEVRGPDTVGSKP